MWQSKKKFERECREAEKSQIMFEKLDNDINATKSEVEKVGICHLIVCYTYTSHKLSLMELSTY